MTGRPKYAAQRIGAIIAVALIVATTGWFVLEFRERARRGTADTSIARPFEAPPEIKQALATHEKALLHDPDDPVGGNPRGDVTLVEFMDYNCPYCRRIAPLLPRAEAADPMLRVVYKEIPILGPDSLYAAKAALAANRQGKYVAFHRALMDAKGVAARGLVLAIAGKAGIDVALLERTIDDPSIQAAIDRNLVLARALGIFGTPTFIVGDQAVSGTIDLETVQDMVRHARTAR